MKGKFGLIHNGKIPLESMVPKFPDLRYWRAYGKNNGFDWLKVYMASFFSREKNEKFACEKFLARNKVREICLGQFHYF